MKRTAARHVSIAITAALAAALWACADSPAMAGSNTVLIVDASNSMNGSFDGGTKLGALKEAINTVAPANNFKIDLGVVVFGSRETQNCGDIRTLVSPGPGGAARAGSAVQAISAQGVSAVAHTLRVAANQASYRERAASIVLVADSAGVANCRLNTCEVAAELNRTAVDIAVHVIALAAKSSEIPSLQCIAKATGGTFASATNRRSLNRALSAAFARAAAQEQTEVALTIVAPRPKPPAPALSSGPTTASAEAASQSDAIIPPSVEAKPPPDVTVTATGEPLPPLGERPPLPGPVTSNVGDDQPPGEIDVAETSESNVSVFAPSRANSEITSAEPGTDAAGDAAIPPTNEGLMAPSQGSRIAAVDQVDSTTQTPQSTNTVRSPSGPDPAPRVAPELPGQSASKFAETTSKSLPAPPLTTILMRRGSNAPLPADAASAQPSATTAPLASQAAGAATGRIKLSAYIIANTKPVASGLKWQIVEAGNENSETPIAESSDPTPELVVPIGDYQVRGVFGSATKTTPVTVQAGATATVDLILEAGGLQITPLNAGAEAPDAMVLNTIYAIGDTSQPVVQDVASGQVIYLNAGTYRIESRYGNANAAAIADIKVLPGKLTKAKINHRAGSAAFRLVGEGSDAPLDDTVWQMLSSDGQVITRSREATPSYVFAEGSYDVVVEHADKTYRSTFEIKASDSVTEVEVVAR